MRAPIINRFLMFLLIGLRPFFGPGHCRFAVTCTKFALHQLQEHSALYALWAIFKRILSCNPII